MSQSYTNYFTYATFRISPTPQSPRAATSLTSNIYPLKKGEPLVVRLFSLMPYHYSVSLTRHADQVNPVRIGCQVNP